MKEATFCVELVDLKSNSKVGYVASKLASQMSDDAWASRSQVVPIRTKVTILAEGQMLK
jgi:predicted transglutaminase-like protease